MSPIQTPWSRDAETLFQLKIEKTKRFIIFDPPKRGGSFFDPRGSFFDPPPPGPDQKLIGGMCLLDKTMI